MAHLTRLPVFAAALLATSLLAACGGQPETGPTDPTGDAAVIAGLEGGEPLPEGNHSIGFPWIGKQSVMCVGDSVERQIAFVDFTDGTPGKIGQVEVTGKDSASGTFTVPIAMLRTGHDDRDTKLKNHNWLEVEKQSDLVLDCKSMTRVTPTVWRVEGTWSMKGVERPVTFYANVRYIGEMQRVGSKVVRVKASFPIQLKEFEIVNPAVGTPAVASTWDIDVVLLGVITN
jgi:polyisoprenoid-binding protein YceI